MHNSSYAMICHYIATSVEMHYYIENFITVKVVCVYMYAA